MTKCKTILIIEDDEGIREALRLMLEFNDYPVRTASNGKEGLDTLSTIETPCLVLLDLMMPVMDGWAFAEAMKKDMILAAIPIVVVTAFAEKGRTLNNAAQVIKKPVDMDLLLKLVREYCG